jgi:tetratricopeptide (TPR) repeat protein
LVALTNIEKTVGNDIYEKRAKKALDLFPEDQEIKVLYKNITIGRSNVENALKASEKAQIFYNEKNFYKAAELYDQAIFYDPLEYSYYENASISYYSIQDYDRSLLRINVVINDLNPLNGKCEYIKGLNYLQLGLVQDACDLFKTSIASGFEESKSLNSQYCKN